MNRYPLSWPDGWPRTDPQQRDWGRFKNGERQYSSQPGGSSWVHYRDLTVSQAISRVLDELRKLGVLEGDAIISTNLPTRLDGLPRSDAKAPQDPGVAVYWKRHAEPMKVMAIDRYTSVAQNLAAIAATLEALRAIERHGGAKILERAFTGFDALPAPGSTVARGWREVLELNGDATLERAEENYRRLAALRHPDRGGSDAAMSELNGAREQARQALAHG